VVIIGGGIVGLTAALTLRERGVPVVVLEKGRIAGEQSSRNLGWVRKTSRAASDVPMSLASDRLWAQMPERVGADVGYRQAGIMFLGATDKDMAMHEGWLASVKGLSLDRGCCHRPRSTIWCPAGAVHGRAGSTRPPTDAPNPLWPPAPSPQPPSGKGRSWWRPARCAPCPCRRGGSAASSPKGARSAATRCCWQAACGHDAFWAITAWIFPPCR
jgi:choline dehydrogenase-like flavoprotein